MAAGGGETFDASVPANNAWTTTEQGVVVEIKLSGLEAPDLQAE